VLIIFARAAVNSELRPHLLAAHFALPLPWRPSLGAGLIKSIQTSRLTRSSRPVKCR
jgi:hypothetical protein